MITVYWEGVKKMDTEIRLSQCMIVRNEEENIVRALSWGKEIVREQIVVDTGSTDRTAEIAESLGAKVYHYEWRDDFASAKNYAIGLAEGNWIAFLDADEYYMENDALRLRDYLNRLEETDTEKHMQVVRSSLLQLDRDGNVFSVTVQDRIFRNLPELRYKNRIHEELCLNGKEPPIIQDMSSEFSIYHTGYSDISYQKTNKLERDIRILTRETQEKPDNFNAWSYLGRELLQIGRLKEGKEACKMALEAPEGGIIPALRTAAYCSLMEIIVGENAGNGLEELKKIYMDFQTRKEKCPDMEYWIGLWMAEHDREEEAFYWLEKALDLLDCYKGSYALRIPAELSDIYLRLMRICLHTGRKEKAVKYAVLLLRTDRFCGEAACSLLTLLAQEDVSAGNAAAIYQFLKKIYDYSSLKDKLFLIKTAKLTGFQNFEILISSLLTEDEKRWLGENSRSSWQLTKQQCREKYPSVPCVNETDRAFLSLMEKIGSSSVESLLEELETKRYQKEKEHGEIRLKLPMLSDGKNVPDTGLRELKENREEIIRLYSGLGDSRSRRMLLAVVNFCVNLEERLLLRAAERELPYFDTDLIPGFENGVFVDAGAFEGETVLQLLETYGRDWEKVYCYEITPQSVKQLQSNLKKLEKVTVRPCAVGAGRSVQYLDRKKDGRENALTEAGLEPVEVVALDEDISERIHFIKLSVNGMEKEALEGCRRHITEEHPGLAVSLSQGLADFWEIPALISDMDSGYRFYLRCYESSPAEMNFVLYAI